MKKLSLRDKIHKSRVLASLLVAKQEYKRNLNEKETHLNEKRCRMMKRNNKENEFIELVIILF